MSNLPTTVRLDWDFRLRVEKAEREWNRTRRPSLGAFIEWCLHQLLDLYFLTPENRSFVSQVASDAGYPWTRLMVVNSLVDVARKEIAAARVELQLSLWEAPKKFMAEEAE